MIIMKSMKVGRPKYSTSTPKEKPPYPKTPNPIRQGIFPNAFLSQTTVLALSELIRVIVFIRG